MSNTVISNIDIYNTANPLGGLNPYHQYFDQVGSEFFRLLKQYANLKPTSKILDVGCGTGRLAKCLQGFLTTGKYTGLDVNSTYIKYCRENYKQKNFNFDLLDIKHEEFNVSGTHSAENAIFPYNSNSFDLVTLIAVLNHFKLEWFPQYISQISKVLKHKGVLFATILCTAKSDIFQFELTEEKAWYSSLERPLANVAVDETYIRQLCVNNGLMIQEPIRYGFWRKESKMSSAGITGHDVLIAKKEAKNGN